MMFILHLWALRVRGDSVSTRSVLWWPHVAGAAAALQANSPQSCQTGLRPQPPRGSQSPPCSSLRGRTGEELHSHCAHKQPDKDFFTRLNMAKLNQTKLHLSYSRVLKQRSVLLQSHRVSLPPGRGWAGSSPPRSELFPGSPADSRGPPRSRCWGRSSGPCLWGHTTCTGGGIG